MGEGRGGGDAVNRFFPSGSGVRRESDGQVGTRLIAIANVLDGMDRTRAARLAGLDRQTLRDWVHRDNAKDIAGCAIGRSRGAPRS